MSLKKKSKSLGHLHGLGVQQPPPHPGGQQQQHAHHHQLLQPPPSMMPPGVGHAPGVGPVGSPNFGSPRLKKHISVKNFNERLRFLNSHHGYSREQGWGWSRFDGFVLLAEVVILIKVSVFCIGHTKLGEFDTTFEIQ